MDSVPCSACKRLISDLNQRLKTAVSSPNKVKRQQPDSHCPLKYMSPSSQKKRKEYTQRDRAKHKKLLRKYLHTEVTLDDEQHEELSQLVNAIDENGSADLDELLQDADSYGMKDAVSEIWQMDKGRMKEIFDAKIFDANCKCIHLLIYHSIMHNIKPTFAVIPSHHDSTIMAVLIFIVTFVSSRYRKAEQPLECCDYPVSTCCLLP